MAQLVERSPTEPIPTGEPTPTEAEHNGSAAHPADPGSADGSPSSSTAQPDEPEPTETDEAEAPSDADAGTAARPAPFIGPLVAAAAEPSGPPEPTDRSAPTDESEPTTASEPPDEPETTDEPEAAEETEATAPSRPTERPDPFARPRPGAPAMAAADIVRRADPAPAVNSTRFADAAPTADAKDRLLRVLLTDPDRALHAVGDLESCRQQLDKLHESVHQQRRQLADAARRLRGAGLTPAQVARLAGFGEGELVSLLAEHAPSPVPRDARPDHTNGSAEQS